LGSIEVASPYSYTGTTFTTNAFGPQVNFNININSVVVLSGANAATGSNINGLRIRITAAPNPNTTGGTFVGTFLDVPAIPSGTGVAGTFMDMLRISFQVPDTTGITIRGVQGGDSPFNIGEKGGNDNVNITPQNLPSHAHGTPGAFNQGYLSLGGNKGYGDNGNYIDVDTGTTKTDAIVYTSTGTTATASGASGAVLGVQNFYVSISSIIKT
jgi:microcystin-dependent protein